MYDHLLLRWTRILAISTGFLAFFTFLVTLLSSYQFRESGNTFKTSQRAFVYVSGFGILPATDRQHGTKLARLIINIVNAGNTPTANLHQFFRCAVSSDSLQEPFALYQPKGDNSALVIGPKGTATAVCDFTMDQLSEMANGKLHGYVLGEIAYKDIIDEKGTLHRTQLSQEVSEPFSLDDPSKVLFNLSSVGKHNCTDDECPEK
jgi:hypothetical protein